VRDGRSDPPAVDTREFRRVQFRTIRTRSANGGLMYQAPHVDLRARAEKIARRTEGVKDVRNNLELKQPG
jgi:osmotically-inducible protein OsmY